MTAETNDELITALYCRLSVEDEKDKRVSDNESNSISNQKQILLDYCTVSYTHLTLPTT